MKFVYDDGGRRAAGYRGTTGDCVTRAIAIATGLPYQDVYDRVNALAKRERMGKRKRGVSSARTGVYKKTIRDVIAALGWTWHPTMHIGSGCTVHLKDGELPMGRLIVSVSKHLTAVVDGVIHDIEDPQRHIEVMGNYDPIMKRNPVIRSYDRCVYGYWTKA